MREVIKTDKAAAAIGPYSLAIKTDDYVFLSGQGPRDPQTSLRKGDTIEEQTKYVLENVKAVLEAAGASLRDVVQVTVLLSDTANFKGMNEVYKQYFPEGQNPPPRMTLGVNLVGPGGLVEMNCIAQVPKK